MEFTEIIEIKEIKYRQVVRDKNKMSPQLHRILLSYGITSLTHEFELIQNKKSLLSSNNRALVTQQFYKNFVKL